VYKALEKIFSRANCSIFTNSFSFSGAYFQAKERSKFSKSKFNANTYIYIPLSGWRTLNRE
jgi:hypothetical protein